MTAEAENVHVHAWLDGVQEMDRTFKAPRRTDVDLLGEALETGGRDPLTADTIRMAAAIMGGRRVTDEDGLPELRVLPSAEAVAAAAAEEIAGALAEAIAARGVAHWVTTGGSSAPGIYHHLGRPPLRERVDWSRVHVWWGDDRFVPSDHPLSNALPLEPDPPRLRRRRGDGLPGERRRRWPGRWRADPGRATSTRSP